MSYTGGGVFVINSSGQPVVSGTVISSTVFNALTADLATGLSTCITKDGQQTVTANIPFGGFKITGLAVATATGDALSYGQTATVSTLTLSGAVSAAFGTAGVKLISSAFTQTDSTTAVGTVATVYGSLLGATTFATATNAITITNGYGVYFQAPVAGSHVTLTHAVALGADNIAINGASLGTSATAVKFATTSSTVVGTSGVFFAMQNSGATANEGRWISTASGSNVTLFSAQTDSGLTSFDWFTVSRTGLGAALPNVTFAPASLTVSCTLTANSLIDISGASAGQIKFPATQNPSANANTLDDYEEGTFTVGLTFGGGGTGITYGTQAGIYTKIGNHVDFSFRLNLSNKGSSTGTALFTGLPFTSSGISVAVAVPNSGFAAGVVASPSILINGSASTAIPYKVGASGALTALADTDFTNSSDIFVSGSYFV